MKNKKMCRVISAGLGFVMACACLLGCSDSKEVVTIEPMEAEESFSLSYDVIGGRDVMPIGAYYGPYRSTFSVDGQSQPNLIKEETYADMAASGVNMMMYTTLYYDSSPKVVKEILDYGEKYGIGISVSDSTVRNMGAEEEIDMEKLTTRLSEYINHPAFLGVYLLDEPYTDSFATNTNQDQNLYRYERISQTLNQQVGIFTYENMLSSRLSKKDKERFEDYLRECCDVLQPTYLMYDRYPFDKAQEGMINRYFYDLAVVRKVSRDYKIPFWTFIQAGSQWNDEMAYFDSEGYYPDEGQFDWNINTCLAFGAQGISYFPYIQPYWFAYAESTDFDFERNGMLGAWGNKNRWYYYAKDISTQIQAIDEVLMNSVNKGVLACGEKATKDMELIGEYDVLLEGTSWRELQNVQGDALIGCFNYQGRTALYVVNYSMEYAQKIDLTFQDSYDVTMIQAGKTSDLRGDGMTLDLLAGEGVLLVFE